MSTENGEGKKRKLGKGLSALLGDDEEDYAELDRVRLTKTVPIEFVHPGKFQPRRVFDEAEIEGLVDSIKKQGILQPILVRRHPDKPMAYEIIAGERRWRAAQKAELHEISIIIKDLSDGEALEIALVENLQRQDLNPLEEAEGYQRLIDKFSNTQEDLAKTVGKSRSHVANMLRLLGLPDSVKALVDKGDLSAGHARALAGAEKSEALAKQVVKKGLNVRQTEALVQAGSKRTRPKKDKAPADKDSDTLALEREMTALLGLAVSISYREGKGGRLVVHYQSLEQLEDILERLSHKGDDEEGTLASPDTGAESEAMAEDVSAEGQEEEQEIDLGAFAEEEGAAAAEETPAMTEEAEAAEPEPELTHEPESLDTGVEETEEPSAEETPAEAVPEEPAPPEEDSGEATYSSADLDVMEEEEAGEESAGGEESDAAPSKEG